MQQAIEDLIRLGPLPDSGQESAESIRAVEQLLGQIKAPVSNEEARALIKLFGRDDCFGLAWTLLHLIETAPAWPIWDAIDGSDGEWLDRLRERAS